MGLDPQILHAYVMHARTAPRRNVFRYRVFNIAFWLKDYERLPLARDRFAPLSFYACDHGRRDGSDLEQWARAILAEHSILQADGEILLVCLPRVLGYVFNPVSFWFCLDRAGHVRGVLCEVNNTFGETHTYICAKPDRSPIGPQDQIQGDKSFHVSPLLKRQGTYLFRFDLHPGWLGVWIDYEEVPGEKTLMTSLTGHFEPMSARGLRRVFWRYPLVTFKAVALIHWQAAKLLLRGVRYVPKPQQIPARVSRACTLKNCDPALDRKQNAS